MFLSESTRPELKSLFGIWPTPGLQRSVFLHDYFQLFVASLDLDKKTEMHTFTADQLSVTLLIVYLLINLKLQAGAIDLPRLSAVRGR